MTANCAPSSRAASRCSALGFQARLHVLPAHRRQSPAARRRYTRYDLFEGCVQQSACPFERSSRSSSSTSRNWTSSHSLSSGPGRSTHPRLAAHHRGAARAAAYPASSSAQSVFRGRCSPAVLPRATSWASRMRTYQKYFNFFSNERDSSCRARSARSSAKPLLFSLNNSWAKFFQKDKLRVATPEKEF